MKTVHRAFPAITVICSLALKMTLADPEGVRIQKDIDYLEPDRKEKADLYLPASIPENQRCPGVVIIHGGGWSGGDKGNGREINIGTTLARNGYICLSINYILSNTNTVKVTWPQNLYDCKTAVRWLRKNADRLQLDSGHIGAIGGSAGGHLVSMLGVTAPEDGLDPKGPYAEYSCQIQAAVDLYGPVDLPAWHDLGMLGKKRAEAPELYRQASPATYLRKSTPPFLIIHGTADGTVDVEQSRNFAAAMEKAGVEHQLIVIEKGPHSFHLQPKQQDLRPAVLDFFDRNLKNKTNRGN
ncbi:MAG: alpha/beta hydrolase [Kiritimatiellae bacterium]|nr:alpha/beta hydrolase [Kiritimatiellia bacterium]MDD5523385.1 alpha/beta hydrolase [Kiritimatiellia bacterium]